MIPTDPMAFVCGVAGLSVTKAQAAEVAALPILSGEEYLTLSRALSDIDRLGDYVASYVHQHCDWAKDRTIESLRDGAPWTRTLL